MGEFFKPWRRKVGVVMLVIACVFMAGWLRSQSMVDVLKIPVTGSAICHCWSGNGTFGCKIVSNETPPLKSPKWTERRFNGSYGFQEFEIPMESPILSYWSKVIPATLISAYLLLFKPRPPKANGTRLDQAGTRHDYFEMALWAFAILANLDIVTALRVTFS